MRKGLILFQIFWTSLLIHSCVQAQQPDSSRNHLVDENKIKKTLSLRFERERRRYQAWKYENFLVPLQFSSENMTLQLAISTKTSAVWFRNSYYSWTKHSYFSDTKKDGYNCSKSISCQAEEPQEFSLKNFRNLTGQGVLVKEQVTLGEFTFPNLSVFVLDHPLTKYIGNSYYSGMLGLYFGRAFPNVPTVYEYFQEPVASMSFHGHYGGELIVGGYPINQTRENFKFVQVQDDNKTHYRGGFSVPIRGIGYEDVALTGKKVIFNFELPYISLPKPSLDRIHDLLSEHGLLYPEGVPPYHPFGAYSINCTARNILKDIVIELEGFSLRIPASAYIISSKEFTFDMIDPEKAKEGCFMTLVGEDRYEWNIVLGEPFFKVHDVIFDAGNKSIGFSPTHISHFNLMLCIVVPISLASFAILEFFFSIFRKWRKASGRERNTGNHLQVFPYKSIKLESDDAQNEQNNLIYDESMIN